MLGKWKQSLSLGLALLFVLAVGVEAQTAETGHSQLPASVVTASLAGEQARFTAPAGVIQMRLEVFTASGGKVFDSDFKPGNLLDWPFQDQQGQRLADGSYRCVITTRDLAGRLAQKRGEVRVQAGAATFEEAGDETQTAQERGSSNAMSREAFLAILRDGMTRATAVLAHDGDKGRLVSGSGGLSFRAGDFFAGKDVERMRLTPEGDLGIGVEKPAARLDVGGLIRTSEGIVFPDGTIQTTAANAGQAAKDGADGKKSDKGATHSPNSRDAVNADGTFDNLTVNKSLNVDQANTNNGAVNPGITFGAASGEGIASKRTVGGNRFGLDFYTAFAPRMSITQLGNVGIGTANPQDKLHVSGGGLRLDNNRGLFLSDASGAARRALLVDPSNVLHIGSGGPLGVDRIDFDLGNAGMVMTLRNGKVAIGTTVPKAKLEVESNALGVPGISGVSSASFGVGVSGMGLGTDGDGVAGYGARHGVKGIGRVGVYGFTETFRGNPTHGAVANDVGVYAGSGGQGRDSAALQAFNTNPDQGMAAYLTNTSNFHTAHIANGGSGGVLYLQNGGTDASGAGGGDFITAVNKPENDAQFRVLSSGEVRSDVGFRTPAADFAELLPAVDGLEAGEVLVIGEDGKLTRSTAPRQTNVAGVYSTKPGFVGGHPVGGVEAGRIPLALIGIVPVKVTAENGAIRPGDLLTTSSTPGHAMRAGAKPATGTVIGKALGALKQGTGVIQLLAIMQ